MSKPYDKYFFLTSPDTEIRIATKTTILIVVAIKYIVFFLG